MLEPKKKKIDAKQFAHDIEAGMHESALMAAYGLSPSELKRAMQKLDDRGLLKHPKPVEPAMPNQKVFECPSCGGIHTESFAECPHCGIVLSKFYGQGPTAGPHALAEESRSPSSRVQVSAPVKEKNHIATIVGLGVVVLLVTCAFLFYRSMKNAEIRSLVQNVQSVLNTSNAETPPNYGHLARIFGDATGAMAAVMESRRTPYSEKMHELYQKMVYLGELQQRMQWKGSGSVKNTGAYRNAVRGAGAHKGVVRNELESLGDTLDTNRGALADASEGGGATGEAEALPVIPGSPAAPVPAASERDSSAAQFEKAQDELRSLCAQVLNILSAQ